MDTKEICQLFMEIYNDKPYLYNYNLEKSEKLINKWNNNGIIITYIKDNKLLGFIGGYYLNTSLLYLDKIGVKKEFRNHGIASDMMKKLIKKDIHIILRLNDKKLEYFYDKFGFINTNIKRNDGEGINSCRYYYYLHNY